MLSSPRICKFCSNAELASFVETACRYVPMLRSVTLLALLSPPTESDLQMRVAPLRLCSLFLPCPAWPTKVTLLMFLCLPARGGRLSIFDCGFLVVGGLSALITKQRSQFCFFLVFGFVGRGRLCSCFFFFLFSSFWGCQFL
jgi:hypothetical protein